MLPNHIEVLGKPVRPIEVCCDDILFGLWEEECRTPVRKAAHPFEREN
jgi:hypothetical protein